MGVAMEDGEQADDNHRGSSRHTHCSRDKAPQQKCRA
jgi:hypothetical protein